MTTEDPGYTSGQTQAPSSGGWQTSIVNFLKAQVGKAYSKASRFGQQGSWDCSGLVVGAYKSVGITGFGDVTYTQKDYGANVSVNNLQIGDLIFYNGDGGKDFGHVAIYIGNGQQIDARGTAYGVVQRAVDTSRIQGIRRLVDSSGRPVQGTNGLTAQGQAVAQYGNGAVADAANAGETDMPALVTDPTQQNAGGIYANPNLVKRPTTDEEVKQYIKDNYGYMTAFMGDPEIGPILMQAAREGLSKDMLYGRLSGTKWWKTTADTARKWQQIVSEDPATAAAQRAQKKAALANQIGQLGLAMRADTLDQIVEQSLTHGWTPDQEADVILSYADPGAMGYTKGDLGATQMQIQTLMSQYMLPRTNGFKDVAAMAKAVMSGEMTLDGIRANFVNQAKSLFANNEQMIGLLDQGVSPYDATSGMRNAMANILEVDPDSIDMVNDPQMRKALDTVDAQGKHRMMTITEAEQLARSQPRYKNTVGGRQAFANAGAAVAKYAGVA